MDGPLVFASLLRELSRYVREIGERYLPSMKVNTVFMGDRLSRGGEFTGIHWGQAGDVPVPGDYDGDGRNDTAVFREGTWFVNRSTAGSIAVPFGLSSDIPIPKKYIP